MSGVLRGVFVCNVDRCLVWCGLVCCWGIWVNCLKYKSLVFLGKG